MNDEEMDSKIGALEAQKALLDGKIADEAKRIKSELDSIDDAIWRHDCEVRRAWEKLNEVGITGLSVMQVRNTPGSAADIVYYSEGKRESLESKKRQISADLRSLEKQLEGIDRELRDFRAGKIIGAASIILDDERSTEEMTKLALRCLRNAAKEKGGLQELLQPKEKEKARR